MLLRGSFRELKIIQDVSKFVRTAELAARSAARLAIPLQKHELSLVSFAITLATGDPMKRFPTA
jgi:hypothetical protein